MYHHTGGNLDLVVIRCIGVAMGSQRGHAPPNF